MATADRVPRTPTKWDDDCRVARQQLSIARRRLGQARDSSASGAPGPRPTNKISPILVDEISVRDIQLGRAGLTEATVANDVDVRPGHTDSPSGSSDGHTRDEDDEPASASTGTVRDSNTSGTRGPANKRCAVADVAFDAPHPHKRLYVGSGGERPTPEPRANRGLSPQIYVPKMR